MFPYWMLFGGFSVAALLRGTRSDGQNRGFLLLLASAAIILMIGFRNEVGGDWLNYVRHFRKIGVLDLATAAQYPLDPGYTLLNWFSSQLGAGIWLVNLVCGAMLVWGIYRIAVRQPNPWLAFVVAIPYLIIVVGMGYTRQAAAIGLTMVAISAFLDQRWRAFFSAMIGAALFHQTSLILFPVFALAISTNRYFAVAMILVIPLMLGQFLVTEEEVSKLTRSYITEEMESQGAWIRVIMNVIPAVLFLVKQRQYGFSEQERKVWRNISISAIIALLILFIFEWSTAIDRLALYFLVLQAVILTRIPWVLSKDGRGQILLIGCVIVYSATIQFVWLNYAVHAVVWVPYKSALLQ